MALTVRTPGLVVTEHEVEVPLDHPDRPATLDQVAAFVGLGDPGAVVDQLDDHPHLPRVVRLRHAALLEGVGFTLGARTGGDHPWWRSPPER